MATLFGRTSLSGFSVFAAVRVLMWINEPSKSCCIGD